MFQQNDAPVAGSLVLSALIALLPLLTISLMLGVFKSQAYVAALTTLGVALVVSVTAFKMPVDLALLSGAQGATFGFWPIMWIVITAVWVYQLTVISGRFKDLRSAFELVSDDPRVQAVIIAFCFGGLLEALTGFGAPVAITGVLMMGMGFSPLRAATVALVANTAPVGYGAIATPVITAGTLTKIDYNVIGAYVGRQCPVLAVVVPLLLVVIVDGWRGLRQTWPVALVTGLAFGIGQFVASNYISVELTDIVASLTALATAVLFLRVWSPARSDGARADLQQERESELRQVGGPRGGSGAAVAVQRTAGGGRHASTLDAGRTFAAFLPYLIIIVVFSIAKIPASARSWLAGTDLKFGWPGLDGHISTAAGKPYAAIFSFSWLSSPGTMLLLCGVLVAMIYRIGPVRAASEFFTIVLRMRFALLTVLSVLGLAYVLNASGQTITIGKWIAGAGVYFAFFAPILGWLGTAVTGSDTSANALFASLQQTVGKQTGIDPTLLVAANTTGGVLGKMISPQNLTIAVTAVGLIGKEGVVFRKTLGWSLGLLLLICVVIGLQSTPVLDWMLGVGTLGQAR